MTTPRIVACALAVSALATTGLAAQTRPIDYPDLFRFAQIGQATLSPDGRQVVYSVTEGSYPAPDGETQLYLATLDGRVNRQLTFLEEANPGGVRWHPSGRFIAFVADRGAGRHLYFMDPNGGGEPRPITHGEEGAGSWAWNADGSRLAFLTGQGAAREIWISDGEGKGRRKLTDHATPISSFSWSEDGREIFFLAPERYDAADARRRREGFRARTIQRGITADDYIDYPPVHLWKVAVSGGDPVQLTSGEIRVGRYEESPRGGLIAVSWAPLDVHQDGPAGELYLLDPATGRSEQITHNDVGEQLIGFSPDGSQIAISAPRAFEGEINQIFVRPTGGGEWRAVTAGFDGNPSGARWTADGKGFYFVADQGVDNQLFHADAARGTVRKLTSHRGLVSVAAGEGGGPVVLSFTDPENPTDLYATTWARVGDRQSWVRLTDVNAWADELKLARYETVRWKSADGTEIEGILTYPLGYQPGRSYPLITDIHGGPAAAYQNMFDPTRGRPQRGYMHLLARYGYAVFRPNYRGSTAYGETFMAEIAGNYWEKATQDIHAGIDTLIARGIAHPDSLGFMGWSAGGHWSNWMLVTTDRFKAISSGAGVANWISLYAQTDNQSSREFYLGGSNAPDARNKPWDSYEHWWNESPMKYIARAKTPTLLHYGSADERIPMPQGQELHMALKKLGVPTEFIVYPDERHALAQPRNQLVKIMAEVGWFEKWIRGKEKWLDWEEVLEVSEEIEKALAGEEATPAEGTTSR